MKTMLLLWLGACGAEKSAGDDGASEDLSRAAEVWETLAGFEQWGSPAGWDGVRASCDGTHGPWVQTWANETALEALRAGQSPLPEGAALVKAAYADDGNTLRGYAVMQKEGRAATEAGGWFWASYDASGAPLRAGALAMCADCHASAANDHVRSGDGPGAATSDDCE